MVADRLILLLVIGHINRPLFLPRPLTCAAVKVARDNASLDDVFVPNEAFPATVRALPRWHIENRGHAVRRNDKASATAVIPVN